MTAALTLRWDDPEKAADFIQLHAELRRQGWLPDPSREALLELVEAAVVTDDTGQS